MKKLYCLIALGLLSASALAADPNPKDPMHEMDDSGHQSDKESHGDKDRHGDAADPKQKNPMHEMAARHHVGASDLQDLRAKGMNWSDIGRALAVSDKAGIPMSEVLGQRQAGRGWDQIAKEHGFKMSDVDRPARDIEREGKKAERAEHRGSGHDAGRHGDTDRHGDADHHGDQDRGGRDGRGDMGHGDTHGGDRGGRDQGQHH